MNRPLCLLTFVTLAAGQAMAAEPLKIAAPGLQTVKISKEMAEFCNQHLSAALTQHSFRVLTPAEITAVLGLERQRKLIGCEEDTSCVAELANALGVQAVLLGSVGSFGDLFQVNLKIIS